MGQRAPVRWLGGGGSAGGVKRRKSLFERLLCSLDRLERLDPRDWRLRWRGIAMAPLGRNIAGWI